MLNNFIPELEQFKAKVGVGRHLNVTYRLFDTPRFIQLLEQNDVKISAKAKKSMNAQQIQADVLLAGYDPILVKQLLELSEKPLFQENLVWKGLKKLGMIDLNSHHPLLGVWKKGGKRVANGVTNAGKAGVASRINGSGAEAAFTFIAVGTGTTAFNAADTTLETESSTSGLSRAAATASRVTVDVTNDGARLVLTFTVTGTVAVTESGVLNASSAGVLLCRQTFSAINVVNGDSLQVTWTIDVD